MADVFTPLLTDLYQLTMAFGYWKHGRVEDQSVFHLFFRRAPFGGNWVVAAGLEQAIEFLEKFRFTREDVEYLATLTGNDGGPLFEQAFLDYLLELRFTCDVEAMPEGEIVFPNEPLLKIRGPLIQCQLLETPLLNLINFQTLIATKAARICQAAEGDTVLEFGLRRAQGPDGGLSASRAAYVGGCHATSNVLAGKLYGIPVKGTHAHSWVMSCDTEAEAFRQWAEAMPNNAVFLVDTYDTIRGVKEAIRHGLWLKENGHQMAGIRLDSGDMATLSIEARRLLNEAGLEKAAIVASSDLDEGSIREMKRRGAAIDIWGVGTRLITAWDQPALGGVYKLAAVRKSDDDPWRPRVKLSNDAIKMTNPGPQQVLRFWDGDTPVGDVIADENFTPGQAVKAVHQVHAEGRRELTGQCRSLLVPVFKGGKLVYNSPSLQETRQEAIHNVARFHSVKGEYFIGLEQRLHHLKTDLINEARA